MNHQSIIISQLYTGLYKAVRHYIAPTKKWPVGVNPPVETNSSVQFLILQEKQRIFYIIRESEKEIHVFRADAEREA